MKIHTLSIDDPGTAGLVTMAAASEAELLAMLRENYADGDEVADEDLVQHVCNQGLELHFDVHHVTPPATEQGPEQIAAGIYRTLSGLPQKLNGGKLRELITLGVRAGIQAAWESWEPDDYAPQPEHRES